MAGAGIIEVLPRNVLFSLFQKGLQKTTVRRCDVFTLGPHSLNPIYSYSSPWSNQQREWYRFDNRRNLVFLAEFDESAHDLQKDHRNRVFCFAQSCIHALHARSESPSKPIHHINCQTLQSLIYVVCIFPKVPRLRSIWTLPLQLRASSC